MGRISRKKRILLIGLILLVLVAGTGLGAGWCIPDGSG